MAMPISRAKQSDWLMREKAVRTGTVTVMAKTVVQIILADSIEGNYSTTVLHYYIRSFHVDNKPVGYT